MNGEYPFSAGIWFLSLPIKLTSEDKVVYTSAINAIIYNLVMF